MKHIIDYSSGQKPFLRYRQNNDVFSLDLKGKLALIFSDQQICIGYKDEKEQYHRCPYGQVGINQCSFCKKRDVLNVYTDGDFTFYPELKEILSKETYVLYLAQFGESITKVGISRKSRYTERWIEQGADFATIVAEFQGPDEIYKAEKYISNNYNIKDRVRADQKLKVLEYDPKKAIENLNSKLQIILEDKLLKDFIVNPNIHDLRTYYPKIEKYKLAQSIEGEVLGLKGQWLFFKNFEQEIFALNLSKKIGTVIFED